MGNNKVMHKAIKLLKKIPRGKVVSYKELAGVCDTSPRHMGKIMSQNTDPKNYPCYKVVSSNGDLCGYSGGGGLRKKQMLLEGDGVELINGKVDKKYFYYFKTKK